MSYFWVGDHLHNFLFEGLDTKSWDGLTGICVGLLSIAVLYEGLHLLKQFHLNRFLKIRKEIKKRRGSYSINGGPSSENVASPTRRRNNRIEAGEPAPRSLLEETTQEDNSTKVQAYLGSCPDPSGFLNLGISSFLHSIYVFIGFTLMNAVMTFNVWVMTSICLGIGLGYFFFGNYRRVDNLMNPYGTETTSLNESESVVRDATPQQQGTVLLRHVRNGNEEPSTNVWGATEQDPLAGGDFESSRLIVGAQVHTPRPRVVPCSVSPS